MSALNATAWSTSPLAGVAQSHIRCYFGVRQIFIGTRAFPVYHYLTLDYRREARLHGVMWKVKDPGADTLHGGEERRVHDRRGTREDRQIHSMKCRCRINRIKHFSSI